MKLFFLIISLALTQNSFGLEVTEITRMALERSSSLSAQEMEGRALKVEAALKGKWQNPQMMGQFGSLKSGSSRGSTSELSLIQPVPLSNKLSLRKEIALTAMESQKNQTDFFKRWVSHQAILATWKVYVTNELLKHGIERTKRLSLIKRYLETRPKVTIRQRVEMSIVTSMLYQLEKMQDFKKNEYEISKSNLSFWLGRTLDESEMPFSLPDQYSFIDDDKIDTTKDVELTQAKKVVEISRLDHELASKERIPDLFLGGGYRVENVAPENHFSYAIVGINIPIWDTGSSRLEFSKIRENRDMKILQETEKKITLKQQQQIDLVKLSIDQLKRFPKKFIHTNEKAIKEAELGFRQGLLDVNTFLLAETQTHEVIDQVFLSWIDYLENVSALQLMRGQEFKWEM